ncbi:YdiU family protein [Paenalcaligenes niemegkensis]|uniref:protein adenylyltransferase SelO n=1 Tax=Paenalcaligenes niemegkensis TaxID=2895469 RepID=UPI001EE8BD14|nr:YdiU family protein [Paenalcaligenes niemegkensis]MCQ9616217.1 YdiU family protein [Paenalcaligenes niemegkensis]
MTTALNTLHVTNSFAELPSGFYTRLDPEGLRDASLLHVNEALGAELGLSPELLHSPEMLAVFSANAPLPGGKTLAAVYSGHQFGVWAGQLGDGRAHLLGAIDTPAGARELQLKGSGFTPYSRMGDGRAVLRSSVREYLCSEAMHGLGIATTRALAIVSSPVPVYRETVETASIVTRVSPSFVRFGSFEHWLGKPDEMSVLLHYVLKQFYPEILQQHAKADDATLAQALLLEVCIRTAEMVADWQTVGFCHGVMNSDNMSILGLTIDYGPFGFMDAFRVNHICNATDTQGRYAWNNQPSMAHWNLYRLASALTTLGAKPDDLTLALETFEPAFLKRYQANLAAKLGLEQWLEGDTVLVDNWWRLLHFDQADFTLSFRALAWAPENPDTFVSLFNDTEKAREWLSSYQQRLTRQQAAPQQRAASMNQANPLYVLRNHIAQQAIDAAGTGDSSVIRDLLRVLAQPYIDHPGLEHYALPPPADTPSVPLSCSS